MSISTVALYIENDQEWSNDTFEEIIGGLPIEFQEKARKFRFWSDRQAFVYGKLLINKILKEHTSLNLIDIQYNEYGKPFVYCDLSFNISHSGQYVICLFSLTRNSLGIDIEKIEPNINISDFKEVLTSGESLKIASSEDTLGTFYEIWTIKEAGMKADGRGLSIPLDQIEIDLESLKIGITKWYYRNLVIDKDYKCHLVIDSPDFNVTVQKVKKEDLTGHKLLVY